MTRGAIRSLKASPVVLFGTAALAIGAAAISVAAIPSSSDQIIHACYKTNGGDLRVIDVEASPPDSCDNKETPLAWNQQGPPGPAGAPGAPGTSIKASLTQTANFMSGPGAANATTMPLTGGEGLVAGDDEYWFVYPASPGVDPPDSCDASGSAPRELHLDFVITDFPEPFGPEFTLHSWVISYNDANTGPQGFPLDDFRVKNPVGEFTTDVELRAWDTCAGAQRWGIGGLQFGIRFLADIVSLK